MARFWQSISKLLGGEVAPEIWGRTESDQYPSMVEKARNVFINPRGGMLRRPGLHYVRDTKFPTGKSRLIPFIFSREQSYVLEFGNYYVRFYRDDGWVKDIGDISTYLGDGTSVNFVYPYPATLEADIEIYDENGVLVPIGDATLGYSVTAIVPSTNYAPVFSDVKWNVDIDTTGNPWVKNVDQITSPDGFETIMGLEGADVPVGGAYKYTVDVISFVNTKSVVVDSNTTVTPLTSGDPVIQIASVTSAVSTSTQVDVVVACQLEDVSGNRNSDFFWEIQHNGAAVNSGNEMTVESPGVLLSATATLPTMLTGDTVSLHVRATGNHVQSLPQITGTTAASSVTLTFDTNSDAKIEYAIEAANGEQGYLSVTPALGTVTIFDSAESSTAPAPYRFLFRAQDGLQVTLDAPSLTFNNTGWIITFINPPAIGTIRTIKDKTKFTTTTLTGHKQLNKVSDDLIFEIQSPFAEDDLEELYYVQANDVLLFCHDLYKPRELTRYAPYDWRFEQNEFTGAIWEAGGYNPLDGYPRTAAYFQERLYFGGTVALPQTLWGSRSADFHIFTPDITDPLPPDAPVTYTIAAYTHEAIEWLSSERVLIIGTSATEHRLAPDQYIATDRLPTVSRMSAYGGAHVMPAFMGNLTVFVQTTGNQVRTFEQSGQSVIEKWESLELDWKAKHLTLPRVKQLAYSLNPYSILAMLTLDGDLLTMTYEPNVGETNDVGWTKNITDGKFISETVIVGHHHDQLWFIVEREGLKRVEFFDDTIFTDSTLTYPDRAFPDDPPIQSVGGLTHLEGKTVTVKVDGSTHPDLVVINGSIELNDTYSKVAIGLKYTPEIKLQRLALASEQANLQGQMGRWSEVWLRIVDSAYPLIDGVRTAERQPATKMGEVEPLVTGDVKGVHLGWDRNKQLTITQDLPVPMHITEIFGVVTVNQG